MARAMASKASVAPVIGTYAEGVRSAHRSGSIWPTALNRPLERLDSDSEH